MKQLFKISDVNSFGELSILSFKEAYVDSAGELKSRFHFLTKNIKLASKFMTVSQGVMSSDLVESKSYFSILENRIIDIDLFKAVGEFGVVCSLRNPVEKNDFDSEIMGYLSSEEVEGVVEFNSMTAENLKEGVVIFSELSGAVFLDKDFMKIYFKDNPQHSMSNLVENYSNAGKTVVLDCVFDSRLPVSESNIYIYTLTKAVEVNADNSELNEDDVDEHYESDDVDEHCENDDVDEHCENDDVDEHCENDCEDDDYEDDDYEDDDYEDDFLSLKPEVSLKISIRDIEGDSKVKKLSFERLVGFDEERVDDIIKINNIVKGLNNGVILDGSDSSVLLMKDKLGLNHLDKADFLKIIADCIAYNIITELVRQAARITVDFDAVDSQCVYDSAMDEEISVNVLFTGDFYGSDCDTRVSVELVGSDNQKGLIGGYWSATNLMLLSLMSWGE